MCFICLPRHVLMLVAALYVLCIIAETPPLYDTTDSSVCGYAQTASLFLHQLPVVWLAFGTLFYSVVNRP